MKELIFCLVGWGSGGLANTDFEHLRRQKQGRTSFHSANFALPFSFHRRLEQAWEMVLQPVDNFDSSLRLG
jgi:hypothetical protein